VIVELLFDLREISDLEEIIAAALDEFVPELPEEIEDRVMVVDGSMCPCWSWVDAPPTPRAVLRQAHDHQPHPPVRLRYLRKPDALSDPLPGKIHDAKAMRETGLSDIVADGKPHRRQCRLPA
jgi:hypothetical protein